VLAITGDMSRGYTESCSNSLGYLECPVAGTCSTAKAIRAAIAGVKVHNCNENGCIPDSLPCYAMVLVAYNN